jgi:hypothetical protein
MVIKPIPKNILIHSVEYEEFVQGDGFETEDGFKPAVTLTNCRVEAASNIKRTNTGEELQYKALLFFDVVNSSASGQFELKEKSRVTFDGKTMYVNKVNPIYGFSLHHYEIELV